MEVAYVPPVVAVHNVGIIRICVRVCMPALQVWMHACMLEGVCDCVYVYVYT